MRQEMRATCRPAGPVVLLSALCLLSACATHQFTPGPGKTAADFEPDSAKCGLFARNANPGVTFQAHGSPKFVAASTAEATFGYGIASADRANEDYNDCMEVNGWRMAGDVAEAPLGRPRAVNSKEPVTPQHPLSNNAMTDPAPRRALGVRLLPVSYEMTGWLHMDAPKGLLVLDVIPGGAAAAAGIRPNDVLLSIGGYLIVSRSDIATALSESGARHDVMAEIWRDGRIQPVALAM